MKCPIRHWRSKECDQDFEPDGYRLHFINHHDGLSYDMEILWLLVEIKELLKK